MNRREKAAGALAVAGMCLTATDSLTAAIAGVALLGAGAVVLNFEELRRAVRTKKSPARAGTRTRQAKITTGTSYQKAKEMSRCSK